jgi:hypothetical protein
LSDILAGTWPTDGIDVPPGLLVIADEVTERLAFCCVAYVRFWPNADVETRLSVRPLSGMKRT